MAQASTSITDLPLEILALTFPYLDPKSFLSLCSTSRAFQQDSIRFEPAYWSHITRSTFRVPKQSHYDGQRWQRLYKSLLTQSRVYTWGSNADGCLGHDAANGTSLPTQMDKAEVKGIIADLQCGGWSTTVLTSKGVLYIAGVIDGMVARRNHKTLTPLRYPPGFPQAHERYDSFVAVRQFSAGRSHILGLSDSGRIWSWYDEVQPALHVKFLHVDTVERSGTRKDGVVRDVVAGWNNSSAYINGTGIVVWNIVDRRLDEHEQSEDTMLVAESSVVPGTSFHRQRDRALTSIPYYEELENHVGQVLKHIVLEHYVVFVTDLGKIFAAKIESDPLSIDKVVEIWGSQEQVVSFEGAGVIGNFVLHDTEEQSPGGPDLDPATDVQGSFRTFAIFTKSGAVLVVKQDAINDRWDGQTTLSTLKIPALQNTGVVSMAFGDYHFHARHASGHITSYGSEPRGCGALGLGGGGAPEKRLRGMRFQGFQRDAKLLPQCYTYGRRVWFDGAPQNMYLRYITSGGKDEREASERLRLANNDIQVLSEVSEYIEQVTRDWECGPEAEAQLPKFLHASASPVEEDGLGTAYYALSISAAGWHSGALVLVNDDLINRVKQRCLVRDPSYQPREFGVAAPNEAGTSTPEHPSQSLVASTLSSVNSWTRWLLGLESSTSADDGEDDQAHTGPANGPPQPGQSSSHDPSRYGICPEGPEGRGYKYVWAAADEPFPRLELGDGRTMPGEVPVCEWRYGKPKFEMSEELVSFFQ